MEKHRTGNFISILRKEKGLTQRELASALCITDKAVSRWETGKSYPDVEMFQKIAEYFGVSVNELLQGERIPEENFVAVSDKNIVHTLKLLKKNEERFSVIIVMLVILILILACVFGNRLDNFMHGVKTTNLEVTSNDAGVIMSCIDGYIISETGKPAKLDFIDMELYGDKTVVSISTYGATAEERQFSSSANKDIEDFPEVYIHVDNDKIESDSFMNTSNITDFINNLDLREFDDEFSLDARYYLTMPDGISNEDYVYQNHASGKRYVYDIEFKQFREIYYGEKIKCPYAYIVVFKYDDNGNGSSIAHIIWPKAL